MKPENNNIQILQNLEILSVLADMCCFLDYEARRTHNPYGKNMKSHSSMLKNIYLSQKDVDLPMPTTPMLNPVDALKRAGAGNPGAIIFITELFSEFNPNLAAQILERMLFNGIKGSRLYMLWNDCCERDTAKTALIALTYPIKDIKAHINYDAGRGIPYKSATKEGEKV